MSGLSENWEERVQRHFDAYLSRGCVAKAAEHTDSPTGQALLWCEDVTERVSPSGQRVARQIARLCGEDSQLVISQRSLSDAVGHRNSAGNSRSYTERGVRVLVESGWLRVQVVGQGRAARTAYFLMPGELSQPVSAASSLRAA